jgi:hypothetical protein
MEPERFFLWSEIRMCISYVCMLGRCIYRFSFPFVDVVVSVGLWVCDVLFSYSYLPMACPGIQILLAQGCTSIVGCTLEFLDVYWVFSYRMWTVCCLHEWLCGTDAIGVLPAWFFYVMCQVLLSAGVVWICVTVLYSDYIWRRIWDSGDQTVFRSYKPTIHALIHSWFRSWEESHSKQERTLANTT